MNDISQILSHISIYVVAGFLIGVLVLRWIFRVAAIEKLLEEIRDRLPKKEVPPGTSPEALVQDQKDDWSKRLM